MSFLPVWTKVPSENYSLREVHIIEKVSSMNVSQLHTAGCF